jgi:hypothetical protein
MKVIDAFLASGKFSPVQININKPLPQGTEPQITQQYFDQAKAIFDALSSSLPCGVGDRLLWLWLGSELDSARKSADWDKNAFNVHKRDTLYAAWELLDNRVNPPKEPV